MFKKVDPQINFNKLEQDVLEYWRAEKMLQKVAKARKDGEPFVFFEGPPTANAQPALHHIEARAFKDIIPRYQTMRGKRVDRKAGWDTHGLPVELQVEKKLGLKNKKEIEAYGIAKFNEECKKDVWTYKEAWEKLTERIGFWLDLDNPYITYENSYIESVWAILKHVADRDLLYQGHKVVPYCTRCGTALSSHEVAQGYKNVTDTSVYVKFKVESAKLKVAEGKPLYILAWTTTPWTLPGNVALAVGSDVEYMIVEVEGENYILAKDLVDSVLPDTRYELRDSLKGSELVGLQYEPLFPDLIKDNGKTFRIYAADFVTTQDGTGVVHTAVMYGEDDYNLGLAVGLPTEHTVGEDGRFLPHTGELAGKYVKASETEKQIIESLQSRDLLLKSEPYTHDYPFCWRCDTALLYYARTSWFIKMSQLREELVRRNHSIHWEPMSIKEGRMGEWLENVKDWAISRERYWGTPLPIWTCQQGHITVVSSVAELKQYGAQVPDDLHRPFIDEVTFACPQCKTPATRVPEVADVWLDSGSMPFAQWGYPHQSGSQEQLEPHYPADFISEAIDQTRGWFYTLLAVATLMEKEAPYKNVICLGHVLDENGKKMSKSKGNIVDPWQIIEKYGVDALRFYFYSVNPPGEPKLFTEKDVQTVQRRVMLLWWNVYSFFVTYANQSNWEFNSQLSTLNSQHILDRWVMARMNQVIKTVTDSLDIYDVLTASRTLADFIDDLSTWYLRRSRSRFNENAGGQDREAAFSTLYQVLVTLSQLMAPLTPFVAEETHRNLIGSSVHLSDWPIAVSVDEDILKTMKQVREIVSSGLDARMKAGIKVRQKLDTLAILGDHTNLQGNKEYLDIIKDEVNVNKVQVATDAPQEWPRGNAGIGDVALDPVITPELKREGMQRELIRAIQDMRKKAGLSVQDKARVEWTSNDAEVIGLLSQEGIDDLQTATRSTITQSENTQGQVFDLNGHSITIALKKVE